MKLQDVLDEMKQKHGLKSNRALANFIGIDERRVPEYYKGREPMDDDYALIAIASGRRIDELQTMVKLARETNEKSRAIWSRYYKSIGGYAASFVIGFFLSVTFIVTSTENAYANQEVTKANLPEYKLCGSRVVFTPCVYTFRVRPPAILRQIIRRRVSIRLPFEAPFISLGACQVNKAVSLDLTFNPYLSLPDWFAL